MISRICQALHGVSWILIFSTISLAGDVKQDYDQLWSFSEDVSFLGRHTNVVLLESGKSRVAVVPDYQGRVMTSSTGSPQGTSFGWLNYPVIKNGILEPEEERGELEAHIYVFGGEDRFWLGPEGGQYGLFFEPGSEFIFQNWTTPALIDTKSYSISERSSTHARFFHEDELVNYSGTRFQFEIDRLIRIFDRREIELELNIDLPSGVHSVGYVSENSITNTGSEIWTQKSGLLSIWILGMYQPSPKTTVVIPIKTNSQEPSQNGINDSYFGKVPEDRIKVEKDVVYFKGDGLYRSKIGISPARAKGIAGSWNADLKALTIVTYSQPKSAEKYVNSMWEIQDHPYNGDAINAYNDGAPAPGEKPLGPFYEIESSSPAASLGPGEKMKHLHRTFHFEGSRSQLDSIARSLLGKSLDSVEKVFLKKNEKFIIDQNSSRSSVTKINSEPVASLHPDTKVISLKSLLDEMVDHESVARWPHPEFMLKQASSYERDSKTPDDAEGWFANHDWSWFLRNEINNGRKEWVLMDAEGPGAIVRMWAASQRPVGDEPKGMLRFYIDGSDEPAIEGSLHELLSGRSFIKHPLSMANQHEEDHLWAGNNLFLPIPYAKRCKITYEQENIREMENASLIHAFWYNVNYRSYEAGTKVRSFSMADYLNLKEKLAEVIEKLKAPRTEAIGNKTSHNSVIQPGGRIAVELPDGPSAVRSLQIRISSSDQQQALRSTVLEMVFDGATTVWCPVGDFSGSGVGLNPFHDWYRSVDEDGTMTVRWVMPYQNSASLVLHNLYSENVEASIELVTGEWDWDERSMHFYSGWRYDEHVHTTPFHDWNYINLKGRGVFVGDTLTLLNPAYSWWGEGDEKITVDNEDFPSHFGTGTEDYYGYAWGKPIFFDGPFAAQPRADGEGHNFGYTVNSRVRSLDGLPFRASLNHEMEVWHWSQNIEMIFAVATHWYAFPGLQSNREPQPEAASTLIAEPYYYKYDPSAIECETLEITSKTKDLVARKMSIMEAAGLQPSGDYVFWVEARSPADFVELRLPAPDNQQRDISIFTMKTPDAPVLNFQINGKKVKPPLDTYSPNAVISGAINLGRFKPRNNAFIIRIQATDSRTRAKQSKYAFGIDKFVLSKE